MAKPRTWLPIGDGFVVIALAYDPDDHAHRTDVSVANARLMAAAPDLLAACERALGLLELHGSGKLAQTPAGDDLRAAIAKAKQWCRAIPRQERAGSCDQRLWHGGYCLRTATHEVLQGRYKGERYCARHCACYPQVKEERRAAAIAKARGNG